MVYLPTYQVEVAYIQDAPFSCCIVIKVNWYKHSTTNNRYVHFLNQSLIITLSPLPPSSQITLHCITILSFCVAAVLCNAHNALLNYKETTSGNSRLQLHEPHVAISLPHASTWHSLVAVNQYIPNYYSLYLFRKNGSLSWANLPQELTSGPVMQQAVTLSIELHKQSTPFH